MTRRKSLVLLFALLLCLILPACSTSPESTTVPEETFYLSPPEKGIPDDYIYDAITVDTTRYEYRSPDEIDVLIIGANLPNNVLLCYSLSGIEYLRDGEWTPLPFYKKGLEAVVGDGNYFWHYSTKSEQDTGIMWTINTIKVKEIAVPLVPGQYRAVVYLPDTQLYAPFDIVE